MAGNEATAITAPKTAENEAKTITAPGTNATNTDANKVIPSKYSRRVVLKNILERSDGGVGLVGERVVVGGWVRSSLEKKSENVPAPASGPAPAPAPATDQKAPEVVRKDVSCVEFIQTKIPLFRSIIKVLGGGGPVRTKPEPASALRPLPSIAFLKVTDGSSVATLQVAVESSVVPPSQVLPTGTCILVEGILREPATEGRQKIELKVEQVLHIGTVHQNTYILSKKRLPIEALRSCFHFRPRTTTVASIMRIRSALSLATHTFFHDHGFLDIQVPIITTTDCEGLSQKFQVTASSSKAGRKEDAKVTKDTATDVSLDAIKAAINEKSRLVEELKRTESNREALIAAQQDLKKTSELASQLEAKEKSKLRPSVNEKVMLPDSYFPQETYLTVSGLPHLESFACALGNVYSFGPRYRAEKTESHKQVAEMWMVESEMAFADLKGALSCADDFFKFLCKWILENCVEDMKFLCKRVDKTNIDRLQGVISQSPVSVTYTEAVEALKKVKDKKEIAIEWGNALTSEHLKHLADEIYKSTVVVYNFPKELKPFYVRLNDDGETVAAFDMVVPKVGTLISGSQSEERFDHLAKRINEAGLPIEDYAWYLDLRQHGTVQHSGFSLSFDLMLLFASGLMDVRDIIPFPRCSGKDNY